MPNAIPQRDPDEQRLLCEAVSAKDTAKVLKMLWDGAEVNSVYTDISKRTAFQIAVVKGYIDIVKAFLDAGANPNTVFKHRPTESVLVVAVKRDYYDISKLLHEAGALAPDKLADISQQLYDAVEYQPPTDRAITYSGLLRDKFLKIKRLLEIGACPDYVGRNSEMTVFGLALARWYPDIILLLLENGADANTKPFWGGTPLHLAAQHGHIGIACALVKSGASVDAVDADGRCALANCLNEAGLTATAYKFHTQVIELLVSFLPNKEHME